MTTTKAHDIKADIITALSRLEEAKAILRAIEAGDGDAAEDDLEDLLQDAADATASAQAELNNRD